MRLPIRFFRGLFLLAALLPGLIVAQTVYNDPPYTFDTAAEFGLATIGSQDASIGTNAHFNHPSSVVTDSNGYVFVADAANNTIRMISPGGAVSTFAGLAGATGTADGAGTNARFFSPAGLAIDSANNLYVCDTGNDTIRKIAPDDPVNPTVGTVSTWAGQAGSAGFEDTAATTGARFDAPIGITVDSSDNVYVADTGNHMVRKITKDGTVTTLAGMVKIASVGSTNGPGADARFDLPYGAAVDSSGNIYVADTGNHVVRKIAATADRMVTTLAGAVGVRGSVDGAATSARFDGPTAVAVGSGGSIYVADSSNNSIRKIAADGTVTTVAGSPGVGGSVNGTGTSARFNHPTSLVVDGSGNIYVSDTYNHVIRKIAPDGTVTTFAGVAGVRGVTDGTGSAALFNFPAGLGIDVNGNIYEAEAASEIIRKITAAGVVTTVAGASGSVGSVDATGTAARFSSPEGVSVDSVGNIYVADTYNCTIRKITSAGVVSTVAGNPAVKGHVDGTGTGAKFSFPSGVAVDSDDNIIVADTLNNTIRKVISQTGAVSTIAGAANNAGFLDGTGSAAQFSSPTGIAVNSLGEVFVADTGNNMIREITPAGVVSSVAGPGSSGANGSVEGTGSVVRFNSPVGIAVDASDNLYVADAANDTIRLMTRQVDSTTQMVTFAVTTPVGLPTSVGRDDGTGPNARFFYPNGVWVDRNSNNPGAVYVADTGNNSIRKIVVPAYSVTTIAGETSNKGSVEGLGAVARFSAPNGIGVDSSGNIFVADTDNSTIRRIDTNGLVSTYAGTAGVHNSVDGSGTSPAFNSPIGMAVDAQGNLYIGDTYNHTIRKVTPGTDGSGNPIGIVSTLAGAAGSTGSTDNVGTGIAQFNFPVGVAVRPDGGTVYIADSGNHTIRKMLLTTKDGNTVATVSTLAGQAGVRGYADGTGSSALFFSPQGVAVDSSNNVFVADSENQTVRKIVTDASGIVTVSTLAGQAGVRGHVDGAESMAQFNEPFDVTVDGAGNVYVADTFSDLIRRISADGIVTTVAGTPGSPGYVDSGVTGVTSRFFMPRYLAADSANNLYVSDTGNNMIRKVTVTTDASNNLVGAVSTVAGSPPVGSIGGTDGPRAEVRFSEPNGVAVDTDGTVYVADTRNSTIRKINLDGTVTTVAGTIGFNGSMEGTGAAAQFSGPSGVAVDSDHNVYVADAFTALIRKIDPSGFVHTYAGVAMVRSGVDGTGSSALFYGPTAVAVDSAKNVYVADPGNNTIRKITPDPTNPNLGVVTTLAGLGGYSGYADAAGNAARFIAPTGVAVDSAGNVYVADSGNNAVRKITPGGMVTTLAGSPNNSGSVDGAGANAWFSSPSAVAVDASGNVYVTDSNNQTIRKIDRNGIVTTLAGVAGIVGSTGGTGSGALFNYPAGIAVDRLGNLWVADKMNDMIRKGVPGPGSGVTPDPTDPTDPTNPNNPNNPSNPGFGHGRWTGPGSPNSSEGYFLFNFPTSVARDGSGNLYIADAANHTIRKVSPGGVATTLAGTAGATGATDANGSNARFNQPNGVTVDGSGNVFVADTGNGMIRKVAPDGTVTTVAGSASNRGNRDGQGTAAWFSSPTGIAADGAGNLYVADAFTDTIRKITAGGTVTTVAGSASVRGDADGTGTGASFHFPTGVAVDPSGNLFVADSYNDTIRKITSAGEVTTIAGSAGTYGFTDATMTGDNGQLIHGLFNGPVGLTVDSAGSIYVADTGNSTIRRVSSSGEVTTIAGYPGVAGFHDSTASISPLFNQPRGLTLDGAGGLYVADSGNAAIRRIGPTGTVSTPAMTRGDIIDTPSSGVTPVVNAASGGGGGAVNPWFAGMLALLGISRWLSRKRQ